MLTQHGSFLPFAPYFRFAMAIAVYCIPPVSFRYRALRASASFFCCCISIVLLATWRWRCACSLTRSLTLFCAILACGFSLRFSNNAFNAST